ncbi:rifampicin resistance protein, partial [Trichinella spiralis]|uniref:rifampicin resistance protein n=1 Tax=Trichinella spiralis TaxID=6334 RepID=UPI0001EFDE65
LRYCVHHIGVSEYSDVDWEFVGECVGTDPYLARHVYYLAVNQFCRGVKEVSVTFKLIIEIEDSELTDACSEYYHGNATSAKISPTSHKK